MTDRLAQYFDEMPVVAIIRGVQPQEVVAIGEAIVAAGIGIVEVPLNSPEPFASIERLADELADRCVVGAGTVLTVEDASRVAQAGGAIAVSPNADTAVVERCLEVGLTPMPGWATVTEAFSVYQAGARYLKLFPAGTYGAGHVKAARAVLPTDLRLIAVGGVGAGQVDDWLRAGVDGFGIGSELYTAGSSADEVHERACRVVAAVRDATRAAR